jgi:hypothetical protein
MGLDPGSDYGVARDYLTGVAKNPSRIFDLNRFMQAQSNTLKWAKIGGHSIFDLGGFFEKKKAPPAVAAPPPPPDTTASMLREISRAQTDQELLKSKRRSFMGGY